MRTRNRLTHLTRLFPPAAAASALMLVAACASGGGLLSRADGNAKETSPWAPGIDRRGEDADALEVGHRLMAAGQYELALEAFSRATLDAGALTPEILSSMGSANLGLGRLGQAETLLRRAASEAPEWPAALNNLGVLLIEKGAYAEAEQYLRRAYALDNGESDAIRDNLRLALAHLDSSGHIAPDGSPSAGSGGYALLRQGGGVYTLRHTP